MFNVNGRQEKQYNYILTLGNDGLWARTLLYLPGIAALCLHSWAQSFQQKMFFIIYIISRNWDALKPRIHFNFTDQHLKPFHQAFGWHWSILLFSSFVPSFDAKHQSWTASGSPLVSGQFWKVWGLWGGPVIRVTSVQNFSPSSCNFFSRRGLWRCNWLWSVASTRVIFSIKIRNGICRFFLRCHL